MLIAARALTMKKERVRRLCEVCRQLNFEALRNPVVNDLPSIQQGSPDKSRHPFKDKRDDAHKIQKLGYLKDIESRAVACALCALLVKVVSRDYAWYQDGSQPDVHNVLLFAETSFYGMYRDPRGHNYWIRRLSIVLESTEYHVPHRMIAFALQACTLGASQPEPVQTLRQSLQKADSMLFGGRCRPLQVNLDWVRSWIQICEKEHGGRCEHSHIPNRVETMQVVRFINVQGRRIEEFGVPHRPFRDRYVALSYVWGQAQKMLLTTSNLDDLMHDNALSTGNVSQTIEDAIDVTEKLGIRYLWVDALCIMQDSENDKTRQVAVMSTIYGSSFITIIAAAGADADAGLPGLRENTRTTIQEEVQVVDGRIIGDGATNEPVDLPGFSLMTTLSPMQTPQLHFLEGTPWAQRGWTMQERVMSRRVLAFTKEQVWWICYKGLYCEESFLETPLEWTRFHETSLEPTLTRSMRNFYEPDDAELRYWSTYSKLVASYTRREFSFPGDAYDAFLAVLDGLSTLVDESWIWGLPRSHFEQALFWEPFSQIQVHTRREDLTTLPMTNLKRKVAFPSWSWMGWKGETSIKISDEQFDETINERPEIVCYKHTCSPLVIDCVRKNRLAYESYHQNTNVLITLSTLREVFPTLVDELPSIPEEQMVFFWTHVAALKVTQPMTGLNEIRPAIVDKEGRQRGFVGFTDTGNPEGDFEFAVIGSRRNAYTEPTLIIVQIRWRGQYVERVNRGEVEENTWLSAGPVRKLLAMQ